MNDNNINGYFFRIKTSEDFNKVISFFSASAFISSSKVPSNFLRKTFKMKSVNIFVVLASVLVASHAAITRPDEVLAQLDTLEQTVFGYQASVQEKIRAFRSSNGELTGEYFNKTLNIVEANIKTISVSDVDIRSTLAAQTQSACILNLVNFIDQIIELSGYAISNCIELKDNNTVVGSNDFSEVLDVFEREVNVLAQIIVNALIGRNIFTEGSTILANIQEMLDAKTAEFDAVLASLDGKSEGVTSSWDEKTSSLNTCFEEINGSIASGISAVQMQLPVCTRFGGRGGRSILPRASDFFPQL
jgi:hypothetical protein